VGDVVRFTSTFPHKITVAGRTSEMIDEYGEALYGDEARAALRHACDATGAHVVDYHIAPRAMGNGDGDRPGHEWIIEFEEAPADLTAFSDLLDEYLQGVNRHYQMRRVPSTPRPSRRSPTAPSTPGSRPRKTASAARPKCHA
jgi:hypothetical protein